HFKNHPDIYVPKIKEPGYFTRHALTAWNKKNGNEYENDYAAYLNLFNENFNYNADCSTSYLRSEKALKEIYKSNPKAKIIISLRNPYELVVSWHYQKVKEGQEI